MKGARIRLPQLKNVLADLACGAKQTCIEKVIFPTIAYAFLCIIQDRFNFSNVMCIFYDLCDAVYVQLLTSTTSSHTSFFSVVVYVCFLNYDKCERDVYVAMDCVGRDSYLVLCVHARTNAVGRRNDDKTNVTADDNVPKRDTASPLTAAQKPYLYFLVCFVLMQIIDNCKKKSHHKIKSNKLKFERRRTEAAAVAVRAE